MILLIDIGNTRIKWAGLAAEGVGSQSAITHAGIDSRRFVDTVLKTSARPTRVLVANVGGPALAELVRKAVSEEWQVDCEFVESSAAAGGVRNAYPVPAHLGVDRWLGVIAAHARCRGAACVAGIGTAMTIDGIDAGGRHLGGLIVPGPDLMISSLLRNTSEIAQRAAVGQIRTDLFANNTLGAIQQGSVHALAALVERTRVAMRQRVADEPVLILTGGASARIEPLIASPYQTVPDLVLRGLAVLSAETQR